MGKTVAGFTMSLDGFIAGPNDEVDKLFRWYRAGDTEFTAEGAPYPFMVAQASAGLLKREWSRIGAIVTGRRDFDVSKAWGGRPILGVPTFIVTPDPPLEWAGKQPKFIFVTEGVEAAINQAREIAGDKVVGIGGTQIVQQALRSGLVDEIQIDLVPLLLGEGIRLFDHLGPVAVDLEYLETVEGTRVTHLRFRVVK